MLQTEFMDNLRRAAIKTKESACKRRPADVSPFIVAHRGEDPIGQVTLKNGNRDSIMQVMAMITMGWDADQVGLVFESYTPGIDPATGHPYEHNPLTGEQGWGYRGSEKGGMQKLAEDHDGVGKGWVRECLSVAAVNRASDLGFLTLHYKYVALKHLYWLEEGGWSTRDAGVDPDGDNGFMGDMMKEIMAAPGAEQAFPNFPADRTERDLQITRGLMKQGHAVALFAVEGSDDLARKAEFGITVGRFPR